MVKSIQTQLTLHDATTACAEALDGLGGHVETVEDDRIVSYSASRSTQRPQRIEVALDDSGPSTDIRIMVADRDASPFAFNAALLAELDRIQAAIQASLETGISASGTRSEGLAEADPGPDSQASVNRLGQLIALLGAALAGISVFLPTVDAANIPFSRLEKNTLIQLHTGACVFVAAILLFSLFFALRTSPRLAEKATHGERLLRRWVLVTVSAFGFAKALSATVTETSLRKFYPLVNGHADTSVRPSIADPGTGLIVLAIGFGLLLTGALLLIVAAEGGWFARWVGSQAKRLSRHFQQISLPPSR
jgi:hypothetical protein